MKYLIDKKMYDAIVWMLPDATPIKEMVSELKPIEPLSDEVLDSMWVTTPDDPDGNDFVPFARAIEAHILGENT